MSSPTFRRSRGVMLDQFRRLQRSPNAGGNTNVPKTRHNEEYDTELSLRRQTAQSDTTQHHEQELSDGEQLRARPYSFWRQLQTKCGNLNTDSGNGWNSRCRQLRTLCGICKTHTGYTEQCASKSSSIVGPYLELRTRSRQSKRSRAQFR